ncbi:MAG: reverse transcriptase family protein, partial [Planctomycetota bacterium]
MKTLQLPKRSGGTRTVVCPGPKRKKLCRDLIPKLQRIVREVCDLDVVHGFAELRSPVTNAARHVGYEYTLSFDLKDFFDTVERGKVNATNFLKSHDAKPCWHKGVARQGLPTSPIVANIAAAGMDELLKAELSDISNYNPNTRYRWVYTRYADDLTISFNDLSFAQAIKDAVAKTAKEHGFQVNPKKTRLQSARYGRRIITGIAVDKDGIYPTRAAKRKLRAAIHNAKTGRFKHFPSRQWMRYVKTCRYHGRKPMPK